MRSFLSVMLCVLLLTSAAAAQEKAKAADPKAPAKPAAQIFDPESKLKPETGRGPGGEGPVWHPHWGVFMSGNNNIHQLDSLHTLSTYRKDAGTNGLIFDTGGQLVACESEAKRVTRTTTDGKVTVLTDNYQGKKYNNPNDLTIDAAGRIYFTDPRYGSRDGMEIKDEAGNTIEGVYCIHPQGQVTRVIGRELERPNGILVSGDGKYLYVADNNNSEPTGARKLYRFDLQSDGSVDLASKKLIYDWGQGRGPDGLKQDVKGRLYVAAGLNKPHLPNEPAKDVKGGIYVINPVDGALLDFVAVPLDEVTNCAFGDADRQTLYITGGGVLYSIRTTTRGRTLWPR